MKSKLLRLAGIALATLLLPFPADAAAGLFRAYLASDGNDANPCTLPQPCRLLPAALAAIDSGGEIWLLDSANYNTGQVNIAKSVSILAVPGAVGSIVATGGGSALSITAASLKVTLRNLVIVQLGSGLHGVSMGVVSELNIVDCEIANLAAIGSHGVHVTGNGARLAITGSLIRNNYVGVYLDTFARAALSHMRILGNATGVGISNARLDLSDSFLTGNYANGVQVGATGGNISYAEIDRTQLATNGYGLALSATAAGSGTVAVVRNSSLTHNTAYAVDAVRSTDATINLLLDNNVIASNFGPIQTINTPTINTRQNNAIYGNLTGDNIVPLVTPVSGQ